MIVIVPKQCLLETQISKSMMKRIFIAFIVFFFKTVQIADSTFFEDQLQSIPCYSSTEFCIQMLCCNNIDLA